MIPSITISNASDVPIYQQLFNQIAASILRGEMDGGECLPTIRSFAAELGISVITVKRTWEELERNGFIATFPGKGCFVQRLTQTERTEMRNEMARGQIRRNLNFYKELGISKDELLKLIYEECL